LGEVLEAAKANGNLGGVLQAIDRIQKGCALLATLAEHSAVEEREFVFSWEKAPVCEYCGHNAGACERARVQATEAGGNGCAAVSLTLPNMAPKLRHLPVRAPEG
jgi:hypothetical protein